MNNDNLSEAEILRQKAEEVLLKIKSSKAGSRLSEAETLKLVHDLEVHQIELEMLNEALNLAKEQAEEATERYIDLYDFSPSGYFTLSRMGDIIDLNLTGAKMLGRERSHLKDSRFVLFLSANSQVVFNSFLDQVIQSNEKETCEVALTRNDEITGYVHLTGISSEKPEQCLVTAVDITESRLAQNMLKSNEERYRSLLNSFEAGIVVHAPDTSVVMNNSRAAELLGLTDDQLKGKAATDPVWKFINKDHTMLVWEEYPVNRIINLKQSIHNQILGICQPGKDGVIWVTVSGLPMLNPWGEITEIVISFMDITDQKQAEEALRKSEVKLSEAMKIALLGTWEYDIMKDQFVFNDHFYSLFRTTAEREGGYSMSSAQYSQRFIHPEDMALVGLETQKCIETTDPNYYCQLDHRIIYADGEPGFITVHIRIDKDEHGRTVRTHGVNQDITQRKIAEENFNKARLKAEESDRLKSAFLANMSHEIRTPMNGILGFTELLKDPELTGMDQEKYIAVIEKSGARMLNIINDIISISKVESGQMEVSLSETNINEQIEYLCTFFKPEAAQQGLSLSFICSIPREEAILTTDREKIYAILTNLLKNAVKFTDKGFIEIGCKKKDKFIEIYVKDTGVGIPEGQKEIIFERFRQGSDSLIRNYEGAGLGLSISKAYVEMLGGKIWVESEYGKGATFFFTIPCNAEPEKEVAVQTVVSEKKETNPVRKLDILIAEDDEASEMFIQAVIKTFCREIFTAKTGIEALEICRNNPDIDLVLMDIKMPEMDGYEATRKIREFNKEVIIISQTAYAIEGAREKAIEAGCNDYISKPIKKDQLEALIQKYFRK